MNMNSSKIQNLSSEIPKLDLTKNEEDLQKVGEKVRVRDMGDLKSLKDLFLDICSAYQELLK